MVKHAERYQNCRKFDWKFRAFERFTSTTRERLPDVRIAEEWEERERRERVGEWKREQSLIIYTKRINQKKRKKLLLILLRADEAFREASSIVSVDYYNLN